ncbi:MAG: ABC transporter permease [Candidatus Tectomicrobia bacterium]|nr:ABC transporter permease [Candidatus Tectomicrobia bacterium]
MHSSIPVSDTSKGEVGQAAQEFRRERYLSLVFSALWKDRFARYGALIILLTILGALFAPWIAPYDPLQADSKIRLLPPGSPGHLLGTDKIGRDILSRMLLGARTSLRVAFLPVAFSLMIGLALGLISGYFGGPIDMVIMRLLDILLAFPSILLAIAIAASLGPGLNNAVLAITVVSIPVFARIVRSSVMSVRQLDFVEAAQSVGASAPQILIHQILPNVISPLIIYATLETGRVIILSAGLSFLGLGVQPPTPDWGAMLSDGRDVLAIAPHVATVPGLAIFVLTLCFNVVGDGLRDALDPRLQS